MYLAITVDTEADDQWSRPSPRTVRNLAGLSRMQTMCESLGVPPTYLITSEVAASAQKMPEVVEATARNAAEIGAHLHPWTTPPFDPEESGTPADEVHTMPSELASDLLRMKMVTLTAEVAEILGRGPTAFRAGRFGMSQAVANVLAELGYLVDSSVTPGIDWHGRSDTGRRGGIPDYSSWSPEPAEIEMEQGHRLVEIPVTILNVRGYHPTGRAKKGSRALATRSVRGLVGRARGSHVWCRPWPGYTRETLPLLWDTAKNQGLPAVVMMFHSSELVPGCSPYRSSADDVDDLFAQVETFVRHALADGAAPATLSSCAEQLRRADVLASRRLDS